MQHNGLKGKHDFAATDRREQLELEMCQQIHVKTKSIE